jgi:transcriptional regulator with XRE-family HTH domain
VNETVSADDVLRANLRAERARRNLTQQRLARRMQALGYRWHSQTVGQIEQAERQLTARELYGLALALETTFDALLYPPAGQYVQLPGGQVTGYPERPERGPADYPPDWTSAWDGDRCKLSDIAEEES